MTLDMDPYSHLFEKYIDTVSDKKWSHEESSLKDGKKLKNTLDNMEEEWKATYPDKPMVQAPSGTTKQLNEKVKNLRKQIADFEKTGINIDELENELIGRPWTD